MRRYDDAMDLDDEATMLARYREAREQAMFPDEIDTPQDVAASIRFQKYVRSAVTDVFLAVFYMNCMCCRRCHSCESGP